ncbi:hypothetical protein Q7P36_003347 [Cladosporium allicinum]
MAKRTAKINSNHPPQRIKASSQYHQLTPPIDQYRHIEYYTMHTSMFALVYIIGMLTRLSLAGGGSSFLSCGGSSNINTGDALTLVNATVLNTFAEPSSDPFPLDASSSEQFVTATAQFCIENDFLFDNTHIALHDLAEGAFSVLDMCCQNSLSCDGGSATVLGDTGLSTIVRVKNADEDCQGSLQVAGTLQSLGDGIDLDLLIELFEEAETLLSSISDD